MSGFRALSVALVAVGVAATTAVASYAVRGGSDGGAQIAILDDCDPSDPAWANIGGCSNKRGNVSTAEFDAELDSPLAAAVVGHQAWRFSPTYLVIKEGKTVRVRNRGGRPHTFTKVAEFGGGRVPPLNEGLTPAPECAGSATILPGGKMSVSGLAVGSHRFQCCIHPWQRALIDVQSRGAGGDD